MDRKIVKKTIVIAYEYLSPVVAADYIRKMHKNCGLSYKYIAGEIGVSVQTVSRWIQTDPDTIREIHPANQVKIWELIEKHLGISGRT